MVVDHTGQALPGARIEASGIHPPPRTDDLGGFRLMTASEFVVVRKSGYQARRLATAGALGVRVVLEPAGPEIPACPTHLAGAARRWSQFRFAPVADIAERAVESPRPTVERSLFSGTGKILFHGAGMLWGFGWPPASRVLESVEYSEVVRTFGQREIIDSRGKLADGTRWRRVGTVSESIEYEGASESEARVLDRFLDGLCMAPTELRR